MSEKILETLMQIFAMIAKPHANDADRTGEVEAYLRNILNRELVKKYLDLYESAFEEERNKLKRSSEERREGAIAVRIHKLCSRINEQGQLNREQRIIVIIQALEFCKSDGDRVNPLELGFIETLAEGLGISPEEYGIIEKFVLNTFNDIPVSDNLLIITGNESAGGEGVRYAFKEMLKGQIWILYIPSVKMYFLRYHGCGELTMNGQLLKENKVYPVSQGSAIKGYKISPVYYWDISMQYLQDEFKSSRVVYEVNNLEYRFRSGDVGIHKMSFSGESGKMIGIMGASGAGKSTLLSVLNGLNPPSDGEVLINGVSIHKEYERIKGLIGYVSQDDLLIEELSVFDNLYYNARLCFNDLADSEITERVESVLKNLGLYEIRNMKVGSPLNKKISGGQRKRLNISLELIREPAILFLDEPTSGLSSRDSENILDLLKELARKGKLLFVVIHQPSSDIFKMFDNLIILDTGGFMIYNGNPVESIEYFKRRIGQANYNESECYACGNVNPEQVFNIVETKVFTETGKPTDVRRISPAEWSNLYKSTEKKEPLQEGGMLPDINLRTPGKLKQFMIYVKRDILTKISDAQYLLITLLEAPALAFILAFLIRYFDESAKNPAYTLYENSNLPVYIFMSVIVSIFIGLTVSAEEIIRDRKILKREAFLNLSWNSYLSSKVTVQFAISAIQALSFVLVGNLITGIKGMTFEYWLVLFSCWASANILGLIISDSFKTAVTIYVLIPFLVIPQIMLSGVLVKFERLNPNISSPVSIPVYGECFTARWGYEALAVEQFKNNKYEKKFYIYDKAMSEAKYKKDFWNTKLKGILETMKSDLMKGQRRVDFNSDLLLVANEIRKETARLPDIKFDNAGQLTPEGINPAVVASAIDYIESVRRHYVGYYNNANEMKDAIMTRMEAEDKAGLQKLRDDYHNLSLEEMVCASNEKTKIIEYEGELVQKMDPVYLEPENRFIKAHFYSPSKNLFGRSFSTYTVNVAVLWVISLLFYLILYFRILRKTVDAIGNLINKKPGELLSDII